MATAEIGDWCVARCNISHEDEVAELILFDVAEAEEGWSALRVNGLPALLALRDLIDEEVRRSQERTELASFEI